MSHEIDRRPKKHYQAIRYAVALALASSQASLAATPPALPVPCLPGTCAPSKTPGFAYQNSTTGATGGPSGFVTAGQATATQSGSTLTVNQTSAQAILNWQSFNIGAGGTVQFNQPSSTSVALNKIYQASPSSIFGALNANGQVYLINPNGFVFGSGSSVNVGGLIASSLGLFGGDATLANGLTSNAGSATSSARPALTSDGRLYVTDANGNLVLDGNGNPQPVQVQVQSGASLTAADGGRVLLAGQVVSNSGQLTAPDGQVVLAAGQTVYLQSSSDPSVRGLVVAITTTAQDSNGNPITSQAAPTGATASVPVGTVTNSGTGTNGISATRGNVSLLGLAVNQNGRISASTSVSENGSVTLEAGQGTDVQGTLSDIQGGTVTLGANSDIQIPLDTSTATAAVAQTQTPSSVSITGQAVYMDGGTINAPGGKLNVLAAADPGLGLRTEGNSAAQIRVAANTNIDLAGSDATLPMSANLTSIQLFGNELEDDPDQRTGALHGQTVIVDTRDGRPALISDASWQSVLQGIQENVAQRNSTGGSASFQSEGDVVVNSGATINVSGGTWNYTPGVIQTSQLIGANGQTYSIESANPALTYTGVLNPTYTQTYQGFGVQETGTTPGLSQSQAGYVQGFSAGSITLAAPSIVMQGNLIGTAVNGPYQRSPSSIPAESLAALVANGGTVPTSGGVAMAVGGTLRIGDPNAPNPGPQGQPDFYAPAVDFVGTAAPVAIADGAPLPAQPLQLPVNYITGGGFTQTQIFSDGNVTLPSGLPLNLGNGGSLLILAPHISIDSSIQALGGSINLESVETADSVSSSARPGIDLGNNVTLNVSGQWTNNSILAPASTPTALYEQGGSIILSLQPNASLLPAGIFTVPAGSTTTNLAQYQFDTAGGQLTLGNNVSLLANGGAWLQPNNTLSGGAGGTIAIAASADQAALRIGSNVAVTAFGVQGAAGGSFTLDAPRLLVENGNAWSGAQQIDDLTNPGQFFEVGSGLYSQDGFSRINLTATAAVLPNATSNDILAVAAGTQIDATAQSLQITGSYLSRATGGTVQGFAQPELLDVAYQTPSQLSFIGARSLSATSISAPSGDIDIQSGAAITVSPGSAGAIDLVGQGSILIDGTLKAQGGTISAQIGLPTVSAFSANVGDPGYVAGQQIEVGSNAVLDVSGVTVLTPNALNMPIGDVLPAGSVGLVAGRGDVVVNGGSTINISGGSGSLALANLGPAGGYTVSTVGSAGGALSVSSGEAISLLGSLSAAGGAGSSSEGTVAGGSLTVSLQPTFATLVTTPLFAGPFSIDLMPSLPVGTTPEGDESGIGLLSLAMLESSRISSLTLSAGGSAAAPTSGTININPDGSANALSGTPMVLSFDRGVTLDAAVISLGAGTQATITAPTVSFTDSYLVTASQAAQTATSGGTGTLSVNAQEIELSGYTWIKGAQNVSLSSTNDVQLDPINALQSSGGFSAPVNLSITAARVFPATLANYTLSAGGEVDIGSAAGSSGSAPALPLSVGGSVTISAPNIIDDGAILAPYGNIALAATNQLTLGAGSYTSVSGAGAVLPFGSTTYGQQEWIYTANSNTTAGTTYSVSGIGDLNTLLGNSGQTTGSRTITLSGSTVALQNGATVDVSGGGDLSAYEWVPGLGGSVDVLSQANAKANNLYAIVPTSGAFASYDMQEFPGSNTSVGQSVYLSGAAGLPAGYYALLPARYALLPGAYLIQEEPGFRSLTPGTLGALPNGTPVISGYLSYGNGSTGTGAAAVGSGVRATSGYTGFSVWSGSYAQQLAQYDVSSASTFFPAAAATGSASQSPPVVPSDAGTLALAVGSSLQLGQHSVVDTAAGSNAAAVGTVDLYTTGGNEIYVGTGQAPAGAVTVDPVALQNWGAGDLILGGALQANGNISVTANTVEFGSDSSLSAGQIIAVANNSIFVDPGATLSSSATASAIAVQQDPLWLTTQNGQINNNAALLAVSDTNLPIVLRTAIGSAPASIGIGEYAPSNPAAPSAAIAAPGASLNARGGVAVDGPGGIAITDSSTINATGASWSLAANSVGFVAPGSTTNTDALQIDPTLLAQLGNAGSLRIASAGAIDILTSTNLGGVNASGTPTLTQLTLAAATINDQAANANIVAQTISLQGAGPTQAPLQSVTPLSTLPTQSLTFSGGEIDFGGIGNPAVNGAGSLAINNFGQSSTTSFVASGSIVGEGVAQLAVNGGDVVLQAAQLTAAPLPSTPLSATVIAAEPGSATQTQAAAQTALTSVQTAAAAGSQSGITVRSGNLQILPNGVAASSASMAGSLGGGLSLTAETVTDSGSIIVPGGRIALQASSGDLNVGAGADLDVGGISVTVANQSRGAAGGIVDLGASGNVALGAGSTINVAGAGGSPDGYLNIVANTGNVTVGAGLIGGKATDAVGGSFSLYAGGQLTGGLSSLAADLGGFTSAISVEVGSGDLDVGAGSTLTANQVTLSADSGAIDVAGTINAPSGNLRGSIGLFAQNDVTLESTGTLNASASTAANDASGRGGDIELSTVAGTINLPASATAGNGIITNGLAGSGSLLLRAPTVGGDDVSIGVIGANLKGVGQLTVEPVLQASDYAADYQPGYVPTGDITSDDNLAAITQTVQTYYANASSVIPARLQTGSVASIPMTIEPGVVVNEAAGTSTLSTAVNFYDTIGAGSGSGVALPIDLTVRAPGSLTIKGGFSDDVDDDGNLLSTQSSSLRFVAGANLASANPLGVMPGNTSATLTLGNATARSGQGAILETGTGDIDLVSSGQIVINPYSSAVTTGMAPVTSVGNTTTDVPGAGTISYMNGGGNVAVSAGTNIVASNEQGNISSWLTYSSSRLTNNTLIGVWGANLAAFDADPWSVATLGGGDVQVTAGGNISRMSVAAAGAMDASTDAQIPYASGGLNVQAGGNITVGQFFLADGAGNISAGGAFSTAPVPAAVGGIAFNTGSLFAMQNSQLSLWAQDGITISAIVNPTTLPQVKAVGTTGSTLFSSYGADSALNAQTSSGTLSLNDSTTSYQPFTGVLSGTQSSFSAAAYSILPASLELSSLSQDVNLGTAQTGTLTTATLYPSVAGQYQIFAARDVIGGKLYMSDAVAGTISSSTSVITGPSGLGGLSQIGANIGSYGSASNFSGELHAGQTSGGSVVAGRDIDNMQLSLPEAAQIIAGRDIVSLSYQGQNLSDTDTTLISAGRNFTYPLTFLSSGQANGVAILDDVSGPGSFDILAGGTINLGFSLGVTTSGSFRNANLPAGGASITMAAGLGQQPDYADFLSKIIEPSSTYESELVSYVESITGQTGLTTTQANAELTGGGAEPLTPYQEQAFIDNVFFSELNLSGIEENKVVGAGYQRGYAAIATLFPGTPTTLGTTPNNAFSGDLNLIYSQINTQSGGAINLLVPGGEINVGIANAPPAQAPKPPSELGIVASNTGDVDIYSLGDVNVNSSRIFALGGGNILIWSQLGSIDAGNGAKSSLSIPPPVISYDAQGNPYVNFGAAVSGSGIRTIQTGVGDVAGNVNLIAPIGTVNAGDAGIGAAGNINIAAAAVVGAANINFGGAATGVPATVSSVTASVSGAASTSAGATNSATSAENGSQAAQSQAPIAGAALSWLDVFVSGLGMDNCKPEDIDCLKRQQQKTN